MSKNIDLLSTVVKENQEKDVPPALKEAVLQADNRRRRKTRLKLFLIVSTIGLIIAVQGYVYYQSQQALSLRAASIKAGVTASNSIPVVKVIVVGNKDSKRYHLPGMKYYDKVEAYHRVEFASEEDAVKAGYFKAGTRPPKSGVPLKPSAVQQQTFARQDKIAPKKRMIKVIANRDSKRYHLPGMMYYDKVEAYHRLEFATEEEAVKAGYHKALR